MHGEGRWTGGVWLPTGRGKAGKGARKGWRRDVEKLVVGWDDSSRAAIAYREMREV